jgi:tagatose-6-phosphate ketose/aldose isomerase
MAKYFGFEDDYLIDAGGIHTAREICGQPDIWQKTYELVSLNKESITEFLGRSISNPTSQIILTGAGSSAFIGNSLEGSMQKNLNRSVSSVPTTDLVSHPNLYLRQNVPTLMVSFARSGDSPESLAAVTRANGICSDVYHLIITCNPDGQLAKDRQTEKDLVFLLPPESNDKSLAMTSSFSSMLLAGILLSHIRDLEPQKEHVELMVSYGNNLITKYASALNDFAKMDFKRAVFLGSGPLQGIAQESHLKLQELTDGKIICKHDSFLGFRHGPKAVIDNTTLVVYLITNNTEAVQYEKDLIRDIDKSARDLYSIAVSERRIDEIEPDYEIIFSESPGENLPEEYLAIVNVLPAQCLGFYKSIELGLSPDTPSIDGTITRVVKGVTIYPFEY